MNLKPFIASRKTFFSAVLTAAGAVGAIAQHLVAVADGQPLSLEIVFVALAALGSTLTGFFAKDADKTGVRK